MNVKALRELIATLNDDDEVVLLFEGIVRPASGWTGRAVLTRDSFNNREFAVVDAHNPAPKYTEVLDVLVLEA